MSEAGQGAGRPRALVTGASAGLGTVFARELAARGYDLVLVARRVERLRALADELGRAGADCEILEADLADDRETEAVARRLRADPPISLLVNNAGLGAGGPFDRSPLEGQERMIRVHVLASVRLAHAALPGMLARGRGAIVNVASFAALLPTPGSSVYGATKAFLASFSESLDAEVRGRGVRVQALCPGFTHTEFHAAAGIDKATIPRWTWLPAEPVVRASLRALEGGGAVVVPGLRYRAMAALVSLLPRRVVARGAALAARRM